MSAPAEQLPHPPEDTMPMPWHDFGPNEWGWLEYGMADYMARWLPNFTGRAYDGNIAGMPTAAANAAVTVAYRYFAPVLARLASAEAFIANCDTATRRSFMEWTWFPVFVGMSALAGVA